MDGTPAWKTLRKLRCCPWRRRYELADVLSVDLGEQVIAGREMAVEGALADPGLPGDRVELHLAPVRYRRAGGGDDPRAVARGVGTEAGGVHRSPWGGGDHEMR